MAIGRLRSNRRRESGPYRRDESEETRATELHPDARAAEMVTTSSG